MYRGGDEGGPSRPIPCGTLSSTPVPTVLLSRLGRVVPDSPTPSPEV